MSYTFTPQSVINSYHEKHPNDRLVVSDTTIRTVIKKLVHFNEYYSKDVIENALHYLVNTQYQKNEIDLREMDRLHLLIIQCLDECYDDFKTYPYLKCCLFLL